MVAATQYSTKDRDSPNRQLEVAPALELAKAGKQRAETGITEQQAGFEAAVTKQGSLALRRTGTGSPLGLRVDREKLVAAATTG